MARWPHWSLKPRSSCAIRSSETGEVSTDLGLQGTKVIVPAGAAGIGRVIAERFLNKGAKVATCDIDAVALKSLPELALAD